MSLTTPPSHTTSGQASYPPYITLSSRPSLFLHFHLVSFLLHMPPHHSSLEPLLPSLPRHGLMCPAWIISLATLSSTEPPVTPVAQTPTSSNSAPAPYGLRTESQLLRLTKASFIHSAPSWAYLPSIYLLSSSSQAPLPAFAIATPCLETTYPYHIQCLVILKGQIISSSKKPFSTPGWVNSLLHVPLYHRHFLPSPQYGQKTQAGRAESRHRAVVLSNC